MAKPRRHAGWHAVATWPPLSRCTNGTLRSPRLWAQRAETPGRVVAELNLGFWRFLLSRRYDRGLWHCCLHQAFRRQRRSHVFDAVRQIHEAHNRMAHHEPMFNRPIVELRDTALQITDWICPVTRMWIDEHCQVQRILKTRP